MAGAPLLWAAAGVAGLLLASVAVAAQREHGAHAHGVGQLNIAVEGDSVEIELIAPGADIVGFEHPPETAEDKAAVEAAVARLSAGEALFAFPVEAECRLEEIEAGSELLEGGGETAHAEFHVHYHFRCERPDRLDHVEVRLFEHFPAARELEVQAISPNGQSAQELTPGATRLNL